MQKTKIDALPATERRSYYYLAEATIVLGYKHTGTVRAKHLSTRADKAKLGHRYYDGRVTLDKKAVHELATLLERVRSTRGEYRLRNLGPYATYLRPHRQKKSPAPDTGGA